MVTTRAADRVGLSPHKQLNSHRPATAVVQPDFQETPHGHEGYSAVRHQDSESASTSSRQAADGAAVAETTSSPASQPEVMISGRRRRALADLQSQAAAAGSRPGIKKRQASHCDAHGGQTSGHTPAMSSIPRVSKHSRGMWCLRMAAILTLLNRNTVATTGMLNRYSCWQALAQRPCSMPCTTAHVELGSSPHHHAGGSLMMAAFSAETLCTSCGW